MRRAVFRADAIPQLGGGHLYRCLALAHALTEEGWDCSFACNEGAERIVPWLEDGGFRRVDVGLLGEHGADLLVIDHYDLAAGYEKTCRAWAKQILVIDDLANRQHDADVLLDQNIGRRSSEYAGLVPSGCRLLVGPDYALLRAAFGNKRLAGWKPRQELRRILISMGATDPANATATALLGLADVSGVQIDVVLGAAAVHLNSIREQIGTLGKRCRLHVGVGDEAMAALIEQADLAIAAAGGSAWERCSLGLPTLLVVLAENQRAAANHLVAAGAAQLLGDYPDFARATFTKSVRALIDDPARLANMSRAAARVCDGLGTQRVAGVLSPEYCEGNAAVTLRPAVPADSDMVLDWQRLPDVRRYSHQQHPPSPDEHAVWFASCLADTDRILNVIEMAGHPAGVLRLDRVNSLAGVAKSAFLVSILVAPSFAGRGIAKAALRAARRLMIGQQLIAEILDANVASLRAFEACGYVQQAGFYVNGGH
jgi:UDP-2,4-diacetamido-2,4,6-trideoxy-beta-L-altropyranose hydrolase